MRLEERERRIDGEIGPEGGDDGMDATLAKALERREKHRERSMFARVGISAAGFGVGILAAPLSLVAPEFGLPLLLFALRLLALEFDWAVSAYSKVAKLAKKVAGTLRKLWPKSKVGIALVVLALAAVVYFAVIR